MINKSGFTLIEIIVAIAILGIILLLVIPEMAKIVDDKKVSACNSISKTIEDAAQSYVYFNTDIVDSAILSDNQFEISISALQSEGLLDTDLVNPITDENITGSIIITKNDNQYIYLIPLNCI